MISYIEEWTDEESDLDPENEEDRENLVNIVELPIEECVLFVSIVPHLIKKFNNTATFNELFMNLMMVDSSRFGFLELFFPGLLLNLFSSFLIPFIYLRLDKLQIV